MRPIFAIFNFLRGLKTTKFHEVPAGTAIKMYGEDSNGDLVADDVPSGGASAFTELSDVPESYTDQAGKMLIVNENENGVAFADVPSESEVVLKKIKKTLTRSQILDLHNTPVELLPELPENQTYFSLQLFTKTGESNTYSSMYDNISLYIGEYNLVNFPFNESYYNSAALGSGAVTSLEENYNTAITIRVTDIGDQITDSGTSDPIDIYLVYYILDLT